MDPHLPHALRILARDIHCEDGIATQAIREAADEIDRLRQADPAAWQLVHECERLRDAAAGLRLTDAEREAVKAGMRSLLDDPYDGAPISPHAATLRALLERLK